MDSIPLGVIANGVGVGALLVLLFFMLATGRLYTKGQVGRMQTAHDAELARLTRAQERELADVSHDRSEWRTEARLNQQTASELNQQNQAMLNAFGPTLTDFLQALRRAGVAAKGDEERGTS